jgi:hypothetical protein
MIRYRILVTELLFRIRLYNLSIIAKCYDLPSLVCCCICNELNNNILIRFVECGFGVFFS